MLTNTHTFTDDSESAKKNGYYHASIAISKIPTNLRIDFDSDKLGKGAHISCEDTSDNSFCFYLHLPERKIQLKSIIIKNILYRKKNTEMVMKGLFL